MAINPEILPDKELRQRLQKYGFDVGPITETTRNLYQRELKKRLRDDVEDQDLEKPTKKIKRSMGESPRQIQRVRNHSPKPNNGKSLSGKDIIPGVVYKMDKTSNQSQSYVDESPNPTPKLAAPVINSPLKLSQPRNDIGMSPKHNPTPKLVAPVAPSSFKYSQSSVEYDSEMSPKYSPKSNRYSPSYFQESPHHRKTFNNDEWSLSGTARWIGEGVKEGLKTFVNRLSDVVSPHDDRLQRRRLMSFHRNSNSLDSVEIGGEIEIGDVTDSGLPLDPSPAPSAPPPPNEYSEKDLQYDWELLPSDVQICLKPDGTQWKLGKGGFGEVFKGLKDGIDEVAVKVIHIQNPSAINQFKMEIDLISKLRHRHILQFYGACIKPSCLYMVTELMQYDLFTALRKDRRYTWHGTYGRDTMLGIASGLHYLHSRRPAVVHRDIKSPNILILDNVAKIADVGIAKSKMQSDMTAQRGFTIAWAAPEVVYRRRATEKIDIWSFGIILWEVVTGKVPQPGQLVLSSSTPSTLQQLYIQCTSEDYQLRPSAGDILVSLKNMK